MKPAPIELESFRCPGCGLSLPSSGDCDGCGGIVVTPARARALFPHAVKLTVSPAFRVADVSLPCASCRAPMQLVVVEGVVACRCKMCALFYFGGSRLQRLRRGDSGESPSRRLNGASLVNLESDPPRHVVSLVELVSLVVVAGVGVGLIWLRLPG